MAKAIQLVTRIPFSGFYESIWSGEIDREFEQFCEYEADERQTENGIPKELHLSQSEYSDIAFRHMDYSAAYRQIAEWYVAGYNQTILDECDIDLKLTYEGMDSPREYNFSTDRLYAHIPLAVVRKLFATSKAEKHERLKARIKECYTSYDGFWSHYSNRLEREWSKPVKDWDHNQLCTLIEAVSGYDESDWESLYYNVFSSDEGYQAFSDGMDWKAFDASVTEARQDKEDELREQLAEDGIEWIPPYRCSETPDLFA